MAERQSHRPGASGPGRRGFTLVELLVTIGVIALLVAIVLPSIDRALETARSARCKVNLEELWSLFHAGTSEAALQFPAPMDWVNFVNSRNGQALTLCLSDTAGRSIQSVAGDVYLVQDPGGLTFYPVLEVVQTGGADLFQCRVIQRSSNAYEIWIGDGTGGDVLADSDADGACRVTLSDGNILIEPLYGPGCESCGSDHWVCHGTHMGTPDWPQDVVRRLTGNQYRVVDPPYSATGLPCSYGMNVHVRPAGAPPGQLLLLDYKKPIADPVGDTVAGERMYLAPRHLGKVNAVFVDGSVRDLWPDEVDAEAPLWQR